MKKTKQKKQKTKKTEKMQIPVSDIYQPDLALEFFSCTLKADPTSLIYVPSEPVFVPELNLTLLYSDRGELASVSLVPV